MLAVISKHLLKANGGVKYSALHSLWLQE